MTEQAMKPKSSRWVKALLFGSLALNLLVVGVIGGAVLRHDPAKKGPPPLRNVGFGIYGQAFSKEDRKALDVEMKSRAGALKMNRNEVRDQIKTLLAALRATPFDGGEVRRIVIDQRSKLAERQNIGQDLLLDRIDAMDKGERAAFADRLEKSLRPRRHGGWRN